MLMSEDRRYPVAAESEIKVAEEGQHICLATVASRDPTYPEKDSFRSTVNIALERFYKNNERDIGYVGISPRHLCVTSRERAIVRQMSFQLAGTNVSYRQLACITTVFLMTAVEWNT
ncbi:unnamed protein product [Peronospora effusa]|uniref:Uncharacterized protein n=1 Tax=Peronospora effusa TaxID=542832 RepID=A0A3M6VD78_9STRA|nr:hypothetical protein DD238_000857 [Peronospora effusa]CAI5725787.1 unnamed protein product [Peronospora effusa]